MKTCLDRLIEAYEIYILELEEAVELARKAGRNAATRNLTAKVIEAKRRLETIKYDIPYLHQPNFEPFIKRTP